MKFVRSIVVVAAATAAALVPTAALANGSGHTDARGDVQSVALDASGKVSNPTATAEPTATNGDITSVSAKNSARKVKVVLHFADLNPVGSAQVHEVAIATPGKNRVAFVRAYPGTWGGTAFLGTTHGKKVRCSVGHHIDYTRNLVVVKVPSSCLGHPKVVKVFFDDAYTTLGGFFDTFGLSPKIHR
jgi:hypothetical protein